MADVEEVSVSYSRKVQLEQFEPIQHFTELTISLEDGDDPDEVHDEYSELAEDMVERALAQRLTQKKLDDESE